MKINLPHVFVLLLGVIFLCCLATYMVPSGSYERVERQVGESTRTVVDPESFTELPKHYSVKGALLGDSVEGKATPVGVLGFLTAVPRGMEKSADIIFFIFIIGGVFGIVRATGTVTASVRALVTRFSNSAVLLTCALVIVISAGGSTLGMGEEFIPLIPVFLYVSKELGYDRIYGLALVTLSSGVGFAAATVNPFTVQIAQGIAEVPLRGDLGFRLVFYAVCLGVTLTYLLRYGARVKRDPSASLMAGDPFELDFEDKEEPFTRRHLMVLLVCVFIFGGILYAMPKLHWWLNEMMGGFLLIGILVAWIGKLTVDGAVKAFVSGMNEMVVAALVVGFARGIEIVLLDGMILDSLIHFAAGMLEGWPKVVAAEGMFVFQSCLNFFIPSGSGQAAATMPLMVPLSDVLGVSRETAVFAFTCGDGFSNLFIPTSGILMAVLALAKIPYATWLRFVFPLFLQLAVVSGLFLAYLVMKGS